MGKYPKVYEPIELAVRCPFCNGNEQKIITREYFEKNVKEAGNYFCYIACPCGCEMFDGYDTDYDAIRQRLVKKWNGMFVGGGK